MYLQFYGLQYAPFRITPDTRVFFEGENRGAILQALCYAIEQGEGITKVVGEVGTGKTMLCRMLPHKLEQGIDWVYLAHPSLSPEHTLYAIASELGLSLSEDTDKLVVMHQLHQELLTRHANNKKVVVLIEEAQGMPIETLEEIRLLSNLETDESKLLQIVLFGQPELDEKLSAWGIRQLRERITHSIDLPPLSVRDIHSYLNFRLRLSGYKGTDLFSMKMAKIINRYAQGLTRRINIIADKSLMLAYSQGRYQLKTTDIHSAALDSNFDQLVSPTMKKRAGLSFFWSLRLLALATVFYVSYDSLIHVNWFSIGNILS